MRPLGGMERGLWKTDLGAPLNFTTVARISGGLTGEQARAALPALRARHPHLRSRIVADGPEVWLREDYAAPLALRVVRGEGASWIREIDREINEHFVPNPGPLGRFVFVEQGGETWLLATLHHSVGDGMSGAYLMRDWVAAAAGKKLAPLDDPGPAEDRIPARHLGLAALPNFVRLGLTDLRQRLGGRVLKAKRERDTFAYERDSRVVHRRIEPETATKLLARARAEDTTVHGALSAAMILGLLAHRGVAKSRVEFGSPINVRERLEPPVGEELGFYVSMLGHRTTERADTPFWEMARRVKRIIQREKARGVDLTMLGVLADGLVLLGRDRLDSRALIKRWESRMHTTSGLTNLGRLTIEPQHGPFRIETCGFAACPSALGDFMATATSMHGHIHWNFMWPDPMMSEATAVALVDDIVARAVSACGR